MLLQWSPDLGVDHPILDYDHRMLINIANDLHDAVAHGHGDDMVGRAFARWRQYLDVHFQREEALFLQTDYPHKDKHVRNHRAIKKLAADYHAAYVRDPTVVDMAQLSDFFMTWLIKHIGKMDRSYAPYVRSLKHQHGAYNRTGFV